MGLTIEALRTRDEFKAFAQFADRAACDRAVRWPTLVGAEVRTLTGESPFAEDREYQAFVARDGDGIVARVAACLDRRYQRHWGEALGHATMFEALPDADDGVRGVMDAAAAWLAARGATAMRAGAGPNDFPFVIDAYDALPPIMLRANPPDYHRLLKAGGFETEQGYVDYKVEVTPALQERWRGFLAAGEAGGFTYRWMGDVPREAAIAAYTHLFNDAFRAHWGYSPFIERDVASLCHAYEPVGMLETTVLAYEGDEPVGVCWIVPETSRYAVCREGRTVREDERLNVLGIGVAARARRRGVNLAMASKAYLELVRRGATWLSYTLVLDDNWPSRRTAEKLGHRVCASYVAYRRALR